MHSPSLDGSVVNSGVDARAWAQVLAEAADVEPFVVHRTAHQHRGQSATRSHLQALLRGAVSPTMRAEIHQEVWRSRGQIRSEEIASHSRICAHTPPRRRVGPAVARKEHRNAAGPSHAYGRGGPPPRLNRLTSERPLPAGLRNARALRGALEASACRVEVLAALGGWRRQMGDNYRGASGKSAMRSPKSLRARRDGSRNVWLLAPESVDWCLAVNFNARLANDEHL